jgi:hypothetical protein
MDSPTLRGSRTSSAPPTIITSAAIWTFPAGQPRLFCT